MKVKMFIGKDLYELKPIIDKFNRQITKIYDEAGAETDPQTGEIINRDEIDIKPSDFLDACLTADEIMTVVKCGVDEPEKVDKMEWDKIYDKCREVLKKNEDFFQRSLDAATLILSAR